MKRTNLSGKKLLLVTETVQPLQPADVDGVVGGNAFSGFSVPGTSVHDPMPGTIASGGISLPKPPQPGPISIPRPGPVSIGGATQLIC